MDSKTVLLIFFLLFFLVPFCEGYEQGCDANETLCVIEGSTAKFTKQNLLIRWYMYFRNTTSSRVGTDICGIFVVDNVEDSRSAITSYSPLMERRMNVSVNDLRSLTIFLKDVKPSDNGTYLLKVDGVSKICWTLLVINIEMDSQSKYLEEGMYVRFKGNPASSFIDDKSLNISVVWLFDGHNETETENFHVTGDWMWISCVTRGHDGKNVTYRVKHGEDVKEINFTLNVIFLVTVTLTPGAPKHNPIKDIEVKPQSKYIAEGTNVRFKGNPASSFVDDQSLNISVVWLFDGRNGIETEHFYVMGDWMLIPRVSREHDGKNVTYRVKHSEDVYEVNFTLNIIYIEVKPQSKYIAEGTNVLFKGNPASSFVDDQSLNNFVVWLFDEHNGIEMKNFHVMGDWMWIQRVTREHDGKNVTFRVKHGKDVYEVNFTLNIIYIEMKPRSKYLAEGTNVRFKGNPASSFVDDQSLNISVVWLFDGHIGTETENFHVTGDWMWIPRVTREHDGKNLTFRVKYGEDVNEVNFTLNIIYIEVKPQSKYLAEGTSVRFKGNPASSFVDDQSLNISVVWLVDGHDATKTRYFHVTGDWMWIPRVTREHDGKNVTYRVKYGEDVDEVNFTLNIIYTSSSSMVFVVLGTLLALSTLVIICTLVCLCCRRHISKKESSCILCFNKKDTPNPDLNISGVAAEQGYQMEPAQINVYEALERDETGSESAMYSELKHVNVIYTNTEIVNVSSMH